MVHAGENSSSWNTRIEYYIQELKAVQSSQIELLNQLLTETNLQTQELSNLEITVNNQTEVERLTELVEATNDQNHTLTDLLTDSNLQTTDLDQINAKLTTIQTDILNLQTSVNRLILSQSEILVQKVNTTGARIISPPVLSSTDYQSYQLISLAIYYQCDATVRDRYLTLEQFAPDNAEFEGLELVLNSRIVGSGWQNATLSANNRRSMLWCPDSGSDNWTRTPIPLLTNNVASQIWWRLRSIDIPGVADTCSSVWTFRVYRTS